MTQREHEIEMDRCSRWRLLKSSLDNLESMIAAIDRARASVGKQAGYLATIHVYLGGSKDGFHGSMQIEDAVYEILQRERGRLLRELRTV